MIITKKYRFGDLVVTREESDDGINPTKHRLVIGAIAGEWAHWKFPTTLKLDRRLFVGIADGRAVFPRCFEVIEGETYD